MSNFCCGICRCVPCRCCPPCCPECPECPVCPRVSVDTLVAAGTGIDPHFFTRPSFNIPFGNALVATGNAISHRADAAEFVINQRGDYEINYQLSVYDPAVVEDEGVNVTIELVSSLNGVIDDIHFTVPFLLEQRRLVLHLEEGEVLFLREIQGIEPEVGINSQAIAITKLNPANSIF